MAFFENIEIQKLFCAEEADTFPPFTEKDQHQQLSELYHQQ